MGSMKEHFSREASNAGLKTPLLYPDGTPSGDWLIIRGMDSDAFRIADSRARRNLIYHAQIEDPDERDQAIEKDRMLVIASLIADWSFEEECNTENKVLFLKESPHLSDLIDKQAAKRSAFFTKRSDSSTNGQKKKPSSGRSQKARKAPSEITSNKSSEVQE